MEFKTELHIGFVEIGISSKLRVNWLNHHDSTSKSLKYWSEGKIEC